MDHIPRSEELAKYQLTISKSSHISKAIRPSTGEIRAIDSGAISRTCGKEKV